MDTSRTNVHVRQDLVDELRTVLMEKHGRIHGLLGPNVDLAIESHLESLRKEDA